jgi:hypothetical protein
MILLLQNNDAIPGMFAPAMFYKLQFMDTNI